MKWDIQLGQLDVPASVILKVYLAPLVAALFVLLVLSGNVFVSRVKPSDLPAETYPTRDSSVVLETHQLYSRLISCNLKTSTLHLEFKCVSKLSVEESPFGGPDFWFHMAVGQN